MLWLGLTNLVLKSASIKLFSFLPQFALAFVLALLFSFNTGFMGISFLGKLAIGLAVSSLIILYGYLFIKKEDGHVIIRIREEIKKLGVKFSHVQSQDRPQI